MELIFFILERKKNEVGRWEVGVRRVAHLSQVFDGMIQMRREEDGAGSWI
jgi:hypothetical protein